MTDLSGKIAFITGAGRGQGRAHAVRLASAGADVILTDICADIDSIPYAMATHDDLDETSRLVEKSGQRASVHVADVRDPDQLRSAHEGGLRELDADHADIVIANAGGLAYPTDGADEGRAFRDSLDIMLTGPWNTLRVATPSMIAAGHGGSVVLTSSTSALRGFVAGSGGLDGYTAAKAGLVGLMRAYANMLAPNRIRVNTIHPTGVQSGMTANPAFERWAATSLGEAPISLARNTLPVDLLQPEDVAEVVAWLVSDAAAHITGVALPVDAGFVNS
jgi:SDR family mycofactocin-dependent oxidoreductase